APSPTSSIFEYEGWSAHALTHTRAARGLTPVLALVAEGKTSSPTDGFYGFNTSKGHHVLYGRWSGSIHGERVFA
ncbi:MAG TPA: hypothetical protein VKY92_12265, partial [Verrucomicrobiae bacterium]|nr:hypothetical protein [Verrucomicrobiae bacterium]